MVEPYLDLIQIGNVELNLDEQTRISLASTLLDQTVPNWWFMKVAKNQVPATFE